MDIVLIPGLWLDGSSWADVVPALEAAGHRPHPLTLPGMESRDADRSSITLRDQVQAVIDVIDTIAPPGKVVLAGHSGGGAIAYAATDARPERVDRVIYVDSFPLGEGSVINDELPVIGGEMPLPDWSAFEPEDLVDLDEEKRQAFRRRALPAPAHVATDRQQLSDERRYDVPATIIACEFTADMLRGWIANEPGLAELTRIRSLDIVELPTGHWPQFTKPNELAATILRVVGN